jgi:hypothetical protein
MGLMVELSLGEAGKGMNLELLALSRAGRGPFREDLR